MLISQPAFHQTLAITPVLFGIFMTGIAFGWLSPTLQKHKNSHGDFSLTDDQCSWMVSLQFLGHISGTVIVIFMINRFGRNATIVLSSAIAMLSWIAVASTRIVTLHLLIRLSSGISTGLNLPIISVYVGENSSPMTRAVFGSSTSLFLYVGMLVGCSVTTYCSYQTTAYILVALSLVNLLSGFLLREPAQYLLAKDRLIEAENNFFWLRGKNENVQKEFDAIKSNLAIAKPKFSPSLMLDRYPLIVCTICVLTYLTGYPVICSLISVILVPTEQLSTNELAILFQLLQLVGGFVSPFIIDNFGRRTLWMLSAVLVATLHFFIAALFFAREKGFEIPNDAWLLCASIFAYAVIFSCAIFPLSIIARTELFSQRVRTFGSSISSMLVALAGVISGHSYLWIAANFGTQTNFVCYGISSLLIIVLSYLYIPETKGKSLIEIENILKNPHKKTTIAVE